MSEYYLYKGFWRFAEAPHREIRLKEKSVQHLFAQGGLFVRNTHHFDCQEITSFWYIVKDCFGGFDELSSNTRRKVRKALRCIEYKIIDKEFLKRNGYSVYLETLKAYSADGSALSEEAFVDIVDMHCVECWGCFDKNTHAFVGFSINYNWNDACGYDLLAILPEYRHNASYIYYGLIYSMNEYYLSKKQFRYVSDGSRSITEHSGVQQWLIKYFAFRKAYCQLEVHYRWWMKLAVKMLYPFRKIIPLQRVKAILNMEAMQRGEK
jgi:hypothetical protein